MKVLHVVSVSFSLRYFIGNQFSYFKDRNVNFSVACSPSEDFYTYSNEMGFKPFPIKILRSINPITDIISIYKLYRFIRKEQFDIVIAHSPKGGLIGMIAAFIANSPKRIFYRHGLVFETEKGFKKRLLIFIEKIIGFCSHTVVNVSPSILKESNYYKLNNKTKNIVLGKGSCNGVNVERFKFNEKSEYKDKFVVGFIGRLCEDKGINELVDSLELLEKNKDILLLLIGPLDERDQLSQSLIYKIKNHPQINFVGEVNDASYYYNQMDVFILPSYREGFPTVVLEASASSLPVITSRKTGCIDSILENKTGVFVDISPNDIADKILYYKDNIDVRKSHGIAGRAFIEENFSEEKIYNEIEKKVLC